METATSGKTLDILKLVSQGAQLQYLKRPARRAARHGRSLSEWRYFDQPKPNCLDLHRAKSGSGPSGQHWHNVVQLLQEVIKLPSFQSFNAAVPDRRPYGPQGGGVLRSLVIGENLLLQPMLPDVRDQGRRLEGGACGNTGVGEGDVWEPAKLEGLATGASNPRLETRWDEADIQGTAHGNMSSI
ncbi:hypothetical protein CLV78_106194 [Aliiruegeria haliotis]|uniref:Uncharacterized protein n=1 Tax=Aliiruegeria haliotis TaxID=1280846 RepID=A0A2T0RNG5_9RHOB|nr:hypothetical protein CLV78_106194 [Aliiruegeria haliotis]